MNQNHSTTELLTARSVWEVTGGRATIQMLQGFGASRTVARELQYRTYDALPRWVKARLKRDARATRAALRADAKRKREAATLPRVE